VQHEARKSPNGRLTKAMHFVAPGEVPEHEILDSRLARSICYTVQRKKAYIFQEEKHQVVL
jgi:hypothetical protein